MKSSSFHAVLSAATLLLSSSGTSAQTLDEVRPVVKTYFSTDEESKAAKDRLGKWRNDALPHLRVLADEATLEDSWSMGTAPAEDTLLVQEEQLAGSADREAVVALSCTAGYFLYHVRANLLPAAPR